MLNDIVGFNSDKLCFLLSRIEAMRVGDKVIDS